MPRGKLITDAERVGILQAVTAGESCESIAKRTKRAAGTIRNIASKAGVGFSRPKTPRPPGRPRNIVIQSSGRAGKSEPARKTKAVDVSTLPAAKTADECQAILARIIAGEVDATKLQFDALSKQLDTLRRDGNTADDEEQEWVKDSAAFELRVAEAQYEAQNGGTR